MLYDAWADAERDREMAEYLHNNPGAEASLPTKMDVAIILFAPAVILGVSSLIAVWLG